MYYENVVLSLSDRTFRSHFRLKTSSFNNLCPLGPQLASNTGGQNGRPHTPIEKQILPVLWLLATSGSYRSTSDRFSIGKSSLFMFFERFVHELASMADRFIKWPTTSEMPEIRRRFYKINGFDVWIIGSVDGTYIITKAPKEDTHMYRTRKCNFALTLQAICVASLRFIDCFVVFPASVGDRRLFDRQNIMKARPKYFPTKEYIIGDKAYPVYEWCLVPYIRRRILNDAEELYNTLLSGCRQVIERAFALLFGRIRCLKMLDMSRQDLIVETVIACCVLHNICISELDFEDFILEGLEHLRKEVWEGAKYKLYDSSKFDDYMRKLGVNFFLIQIGNLVSPTVELRKLPNDKYNLITESTFQNTEIIFKLGEEFDEETVDGRKVKTVMTLENNKLTQKQGGNPPSTIIREFGKDEMVATFKVYDVVAVRKYRL
ncbi:Fatty acid-binding protein, muscle, partial [Pseudolycoriella hygida]